MVHDAKRNRLYITTSSSSTSGEVLVFDLVTRQFDAPLLTGGGFGGIDLSPDQDPLIVADSVTDATHNWVHLIDLTTGTHRRIEFNRPLSEAGTFTAVFTSNTEALVTSNYNGSGSVPMRKVDLITDTALFIALQLCIRKRAHAYLS